MVRSELAIRAGCAQPLPHFSEGALCRSRGNSSSGGGAGRGDLSKHVTVFVSSSPRKGDRDVCLTVLGLWLYAPACSLRHERHASGCGYRPSRNPAYG